MEKCNTENKLSVKPGDCFMDVYGQYISFYEIIDICPPNSLSYNEVMINDEASRSYVIIDTTIEHIDFESVYPIEKQHFDAAKECHDKYQNELKEIQTKYRTEFDNIINSCKNR